MGTNEQKSPLAAQQLVQLAQSGRQLGRVLDVGCGSAAILRAAMPHSKSVAGVDVSEEWAAAARTVVPSADVRVADVEKALPFQGESFDTVFFCDVIEHLGRPVEALQELGRVLVTGGTLFLTTPNANSIMRRLRGRSWFGLTDESHLIFYTAFSLKHLLSKCHFEIDRTLKLGLTGSW